MWLAGSSLVVAMLGFAFLIKGFAEAMTFLTVGPVRNVGSRTYDRKVLTYPVRVIGFVSQKNLSVPKVIKQQPCARDQSDCRKSYMGHAAVANHAMEPRGAISNSCHSTPVDR